MWLGTPWGAFPFFCHFVNLRDNMSLYAFVSKILCNFAASFVGGSNVFTPLTPTKWR